MSSSGTSLDFTPDVSSNSYNFSTGLGSIDPNSGLNSLNAGLMGPGAGTVPNGYIDGAGNYAPSSDLSGISSGALNGDLSFSMPTSSSGSSASSLSNLAQNALGGSKINQPSSGSTNRGAGGGGRVSMHQVTFANPIQDFADSASGTAAGNNLIQLLAKFHPGSGQ